MPVPPDVLGAASDPVGGKWVLVIGAGCSVDPPTSLQTAAVCAREAHRRLRSDGVLSQDCDNPDDLSVVADAVFAETGGQQELVAKLPLARFRSASPNQGHYFAAVLLIERSLAGVVTLNFDLAMSTALAKLGSEDAVAIITGPDDIARLGNVNLVYLHRSVDAPHEEWVLRSAYLETVWEHRWEPVITSRILVAPVVVFAGLGSPAAVSNISSNTDPCGSATGWSPRTPGRSGSVRRPAICNSGTARRSRLPSKRLVRVHGRYRRKSAR